MSARPHRIDQLVHVFAAKDAIGGHMTRLRDVIRRAGYESDIYAGAAHQEVQRLCRPLDELPVHPAPGAWMVFHHSIGSTVAEAALRRPEPLLLDFHNITPSGLVDRWAPWVREELDLGVDQLNGLARKAVFGFAHSRFSDEPLRRAGCARTAVAAPLFDPAASVAAPDPATLTRLQIEGASGGAEWLFVGRVSPHKAQHDLVKALACYRRVFDPLARLTLIGTSLGEDYPRALERFAVRLGLGDAVRMIGTVGETELAAHYRAADVFVCLSDHEGFCVPLVEAMHLGAPVVAYDTGAVGETVGDGGMLLADKAPMAVAAAVHRVVEDQAVRARLVAAGQRRAHTFDPAVAEARWAAVIDEAVEAGAAALAAGNGAGGRVAASEAWR